MHENSSSNGLVCLHVVKIHMNGLSNGLVCLHRIMGMFVYMKYGNSLMDHRLFAWDWNASEIYSKGIVCLHEDIGSY